MHKKPITKSHIAKEEDEQRRAKKKKKKKKLKPKNGAPTRNNEMTVFVASAAIAAVMANVKYKLMSLVNLSILRSTCLTIPRGLSPMSFLKSPVLLSNMKVWSCSLSDATQKIQKNA